MDNFIVSARKYRPATFDMVVGQATITNTLKNAIKNNQLAQAFLFCGPRGVGKTTCARIMAKTINCENLSSTIEACNRCISCVSFNESSSFNVHELDAASNNSVDDIRALVDQVRIPPYHGKYKVYVIDEVHMLSQAAFNAFLKTLEEPPAYAKFILATTEKHKIIPTILSRCQIFDFARITVNDIARQLEYVADKEGVETETDAVQIIAQKADGAMRDALSIFDQIVSFAGNKVTYKAVAENLNVLDYDYFFSMTDHLLGVNPSEILLLYNQIIDKGFDGAHFISGFSNHLRNLMVCKDKRTIKLMEVGEKIKQKYLEQSDVCKPEFLLRALDVINQADVNYRNSNNKRLHVELALLQIAALAGNQPTPSAKAERLIPDLPKTDYKPITPPVVTAPPVATAPPVVTAPPVATAPPAFTPASAIAPSVSATPPAPMTVPATAAQPAKSGKAVSIKINKTDQEGEKKNDKPEAPIVTDYEYEQITDANLAAVWEKLRENYRNTSVTLFTAFNKRIPELQDENILQLTVDNVIQKDAILEKKAEILSYLRKNLNNYGIGIEITIAEHVQEFKAYLPAEKYKKMAEKNANIEKLRNELDLDLIY